VRASTACGLGWADADGAIAVRPAVARAATARTAARRLEDDLLMMVSLPRIATR
jgi:hypothetical protein